MLTVCDPVATRRHFATALRRPVSRKRGSEVALRDAEKVPVVGASGSSAAPRGPIAEIGVSMIAFDRGAPGFGGG